MLELERQVAVLELGENFKRLSDHVAESERSSKLEFECALNMVKEVDWVARQGQADICTLRYGLQQLEEWADTVAGAVVKLTVQTASKGSGAWHPLTQSWMHCGGVALVWWPPSPT